MNIVEVLRAAGKQAHLLSFPDGSRVLVLPHGGRVLGLYSPTNDTNFMWTNPDLGSIELVREFYGGSQWHNSGGDRTWLAPEIDFFFPNYPDLTEYWQPRPLDPGEYEPEHLDDSFRLVNRLSLTSARSKRSVALRITKTVSPSLNPLRHDRAVTATEYAGYTLHTSLEIIEPSTTATPCVGLWNLLQLPHQGILFIPTYGKAKPRIVFGEIAKQDLTIKNQLIFYRMRAAGGQKISIKATVSTGRMAYFYQVHGLCALVVRNVYVDPSGEYVDVPWIDEADSGYAVQACNVDNEFGSFSEVEYHTPAIGGHTGRSRYDDTSQVWAFRGSRRAVTAVLRKLVSHQASVPLSD